MRDPNSNPYETPTASGTPENEWSVRDLQLVCTQQVDLPKICCLTLTTSDLQDRDVRLKCASNASGAIWLLIAGAICYAGRHIGRDGWLAQQLQTPMEICTAVLTIVFLVGIASLLSSFFEPTVSLRVSESTEASGKRIRRSWVRRIFGGGVTILGFGLFYLCLELQASPLMMILALGGPGAFGVIVELYFLRQTQFRMQLTATKTGSGMFVVSGFSPEYLTAISESTYSASTAVGASEFRERLARSREDQE